MLRTASIEHRVVARQLDAQGRVTGVSAGTIPGDKARYAGRPLGTHPWGAGAFLLAAAALAEGESAQNSPQTTATMIA